MKISKHVLVLLTVGVLFSCKPRNFNENSFQSGVQGVATEAVVAGVERYVKENAQRLIGAYNSKDLALVHKIEGAAPGGNLAHVKGILATLPGGLDALARGTSIVGELPANVRTQWATSLKDLGEQITVASATARRSSAAIADMISSNASNSIRMAELNFAVLSKSLESVYGNVANIKQFAAGSVMAGISRSTAEAKALAAQAASGKTGSLMQSVYLSRAEAFANFEKTISSADANFKAAMAKLFNPVSDEINLTGDFYWLDVFATNVRNQSLVNLSDSLAAPTLKGGVQLTHNDLRAAEQAINPNIIPNEGGPKQRATKAVVCELKELLGAAGGFGLTQNSTSKLSKLVQVTGGASSARNLEENVKTTLKAYESVKVVNESGKEFYVVGGQRFATEFELGNFLAKTHAMR